MTAQIPGILADAASFAVALGAIGAFLGLVSRTRPARYVWRHLAAEPFGEWWDGRTEDAVLRVVEPRMAELRSELRPNGGSSLHDRLFARLESLETGQRKIFAHIGGDGTTLGEAPDPDDDLDVES